MKQQKIIQEIIDTVKTNKTFFITAHAKPDGDTVGSSLALASWLKRNKKKVEIYSCDTVPQIYQFLPESDSIKIVKKVNQRFDIGFFLECSDIDRNGGIIRLDNANKIINIDHHLANSLYGQINWVDSKMSASAEQIYQLIKQSGDGILCPEAICLYVGILTDTGKFQQSNTTVSAHCVAAELISLGVSAKEVFRRVYATKKFGALKLLGLSLSGLSLVFNGKVSYQVVSRKMFQDTSTSNEDLEGIIDYGSYIPGVEITILFHETDKRNKIKVSFRSTGKTDVYSIAHHFSGGGHFAAAGCTVDGSLNTVIKKVLGYVKKVL